MSKKSSADVLKGFHLKRPVPEPTHWYIEPIGELTNGVLSQLLPEDQCSRGVKCVDGKSRDFWSVTYSQVVYLEESRKTESKLHFAVWYKDKVTGDVKLWKSSRSYTHPKSSCALRNSLTNGEGEPVKFPRKRAKPRSLHQH